MAGQISGLAVVYTAAGLVLVLSGVRNDSLRGTLTSLLKGQVPPSNPTGAPQIGVSGSGSGSSDTTTASGSIAQIAESYIGKLTYVFGGPPPPGTVDCSSFASKVLNQAGVSSPGGETFNPDVHGPTTLSYLAWSGAQTIGNSASLAQPGDLCVWQTHMGICVSTGKMVSAQDPALGVGESSISLPGEILFVRRLKDAPSVTPPDPKGGPSPLPGD